MKYSVDVTVTVKTQCPDGIYRDMIERGESFEIESNMDAGSLADTYVYNATAPEPWPDSYPPECLCDHAPDTVPSP